MSPLLVVAAESSKTAWYILGAVLALWAGVLSWIGLSRPQFPGGLRGQRGVIGLTLVLVVLALAAAILTS